jgi:dihydrofolate reductase
LKLIALADNNFAIGIHGGQCVTIPEDMQRFHMLTAGKTLIYGRKTLNTFPHKRPLSGRNNIILTKKDTIPNDISESTSTLAHSVEEALKLVSDLNTDDIFVAGGGSIYEQFLPYCDEALITRVDYEYEADTFMPDLDNDEGWQVAYISDEQIMGDIIYYYMTYKRIK